VPLRRPRVPMTASCVLAFQGRPINGSSDSLTESPSPSFEESFTERESKPAENNMRRSRPSITQCETRDF